MRTPKEDVKIFRERRKKLAERINGKAVILTSMPEAVRNGSYHQHKYRQDSNLYYLTGFEEPETIFIFRPGLNPETVMFVREKNISKETWEGFRFGPEGVESLFGIDKAYPISEFEKVAPSLLSSTDGVYYKLYKNPEMDDRIENVLKSVKDLQARSGSGLLPVVDTDAVLADMRVRKSSVEVSNQRIACEISAQCHLALMNYVRPGMNEREIHGYFLYQAMKRGATFEGYNGIVAGGANACTLHYIFNDQKLVHGDLLLVDCGAEYNYYTGDITRTFPISGQFSKAQELIYQKVLDVQKQVLSMVKPGIFFKDLQEAGGELLAEALLELGLLSGRKEDIIKSAEHKKYYPHGIGHFLGMDVHDIGRYHTLTGQHIAIEPDMVFTIEPGLYIPLNDHSVPAEFRGIGVRIEDNVLVTTSGYENMTSTAPKEISELAEVIGRG